MTTKRKRSCENKERFQYTAGSYKKWAAEHFEGGPYIFSPGEMWLSTMKDLPASVIDSSRLWEQFLRPLPGHNYLLKNLNKIHFMVARVESDYHAKKEGDLKWASLFPDMFAPQDLAYNSKEQIMARDMRVLAWAQITPCVYKSLKTTVFWIDFLGVPTHRTGHNFGVMLMELLHLTKQKEEEHYQVLVLPRETVNESFWEHQCEWLFTQFYNHDDLSMSVDVPMLMTQGKWHTKLQDMMTARIEQAFPTDIAVSE